MIVHIMIKHYIEDGYYDDNYVVITSPSEMDIYTRPHLKSFNPLENETEETCDKLH